MEIMRLRWRHLLVTMYSVLVIFPSLGQDTPNPQFKGAEVSFGSCFRGLSSWLGGSKADMSWQKGLVEESCFPHGNQEAEMEGGVGKVDDTFKGMAPTVSHLF